MAKEGSIFLNLLKGFSPEKIEEIISALGGSEGILRAKRKDLEHVSSLTEREIKKIIALRDSQALDRELALIDRQGIKAIDIFDEAYPALLKEIAYPPLVIYLKGNPEVLKKNIFAIVGSRVPTAYGVSMAAEFAYQLTIIGMVIVSGLARGIDTAAHQAAVKKGESIAVLGSGLLNIYPRENVFLAEEISRKGAVISEFPLREPPLGKNFPRRNRIISGLSRGVLIAEAKARSGALITARFACEQNREVFALPGPADSPLSEGAHLLIKEGAKLAGSLEDILEELGVKR